MVPQINELACADTIFSTDILFAQKTYSKLPLKVCKEIAKKFKTLDEWMNSNPLSFAIAHDKGWLKRCVKHMSFDEQKKASSAQDLLSDFANEQLPDQSGSFSNELTEQYSLDWLPSMADMSPYERPQLNDWTLEKCKNIAFQHSSLEEWKSNHKESYLIALDSKWILECVVYMPKEKVTWSLGLCLLSAQNYRHALIWKEANPRAYKAASSNGWLNLCTEHMDAGKLEWTFEDCQKIGQSFHYPFVWRNRCRNSYNVAAMHGWVDQCMAQ